MKLFSWMQSKLNAKERSTSPGKIFSDHDAFGAKKEPTLGPDDFPSGLLVIGTLGNAVRSNSPENQFPFDDLTPEEVGELKKELTELLLSQKPPTYSGLPLEKFLNCPSNPEGGRRIRDGDGIDNLDVERTIGAIVEKYTEVCADQKKKKNRAIGKRSMSILLKKMFVCHSGIEPMPSLRDTVQESRMEKLLRTLLQKKMYRHRPSRASSTKRYLEDKPKLVRKNKEHVEVDDDEDDDNDYKHGGAKDAGKWVKTDSEYIVLEI